MTTLTEKLAAEQQAEWEERQAGIAKRQEAEQRASALYLCENAVREVELRLEALSATEAEATTLRARLSELEAKRRKLERQG